MPSGATVILVARHQKKAGKFMMRLSKQAVPSRLPLFRFNRRGRKRTNNLPQPSAKRSGQTRRYRPLRQLFLRSPLDFKPSPVGQQYRINTVAPMGDDPCAASSAEAVADYAVNHLRRQATAKPAY